MQLITIKVECHAGYTAVEYPKCFYLEETRFEIEEIRDRWYQGEYNPEWKTADYFKVFASGGNEFLLKHETENDAWFLVEH